MTATTDSTVPERHGGTDRSGPPDGGHILAVDPADGVDAAAPGDAGDIVVDAAGGSTGGAARWRAELDAYRAGAPGRLCVIGRGRQITAGWLLQRERLARGARLVVAPNNVSFLASGGERRVLLRNALHFLYRSEEHLLDRMPRSFRAQVPVVRRLLGRASVVVVPCGAMAERVEHHVPAARRRIVVRPHPVTPVGSWAPDERTFVLVPVVAAAYKNLVPQLRMLLTAIDRVGGDVEIRVTARRGDMPPDIAAHPALRPMGVVTHDHLLASWRGATAICYPSSLEAFGYPLAEARASGIPIIAPDSPQAREVAGGALLPYDATDLESLAAAVSRIWEPVVPDPAPFDRDAYFDWLLSPDASAGSGR